MRLARLRASLSILALLGLAGCGCSGEQDSGSEAQAVAKDWSQDDRLIGLIEDCAERGIFTQDTSDLMEVLVSKLQHSSMTVLHNVREELANAGEAALPELERLVRRMYTEPHGSHVVINALGVLEMSSAGDTPISMALLKDCLGHPQETVQSAAVKALGRHADASVYADLESLLRVVPPHARSATIKAMHAADERRFELTLANWLVDGSYAGQWPHAAQLVASTADQDTGSHFAVLALGLGDASTRAFLLATRVRQGNAEAEQALIDLLEDPEPQVRGIALAALEYTDLVQPLTRMLRGDEVPNLRAMSVGLLRVHAEQPAAREALRDGLNDEDETVRAACLAALVAHSDPAALDFAMSALRGPQRDLQMAVRALAGNWEQNPGLARRVLECLSALIEENSQRELRERAALYQAIGQVPGPDSTELLLRTASLESGTHQNMSAHRWLAIQASNTGPGGRPLIEAAWRASTELEPRMDLLWAATVGHDEATAEFLIEVLLDERTAPHERLYVAERLAREGPASEVAPLIKRAMLRESDRVFRPAMNCLLWRWYGAN